MTPKQQLKEHAQIKPIIEGIRKDFVEHGMGPEHLESDFAVVANARAKLDYYRHENNKQEEMLIEVYKMLRPRFKHLDKMLGVE